MTFTIQNARIFDGERLLEEDTVICEGTQIVAVGKRLSPVGTSVDALGATLLPGLIDAHTHTSVDALRDALAFGVTTELEMMGRWTLEERALLEDRDDLADLRTAGFGVSAPGGHPSQLQRGGPPPGAAKTGQRHERPTVSTPDEAVAFVRARVDEGSDYIKIMIEDGRVLGAPGLPVLSEETIRAAVQEAHGHGKMALAHVLTAAATAQAIELGMDGLTHVFVDGPSTPALVDAIAASGAFVTPCLVLNSSILGKSAAHLADHEHVRHKLSEAWRQTLCSCFNTYPQGNFDDVLATVRALHEANVDILVGTDASYPMPHLGGLAHGASVHHELQLLVRAGLTPSEALRAATALPARRFRLDDRGRVAPGMRADLLLVDGDPTKNVADTLAIRAVWRRGVQLGS